MKLQTVFFGIAWLLMFTSACEFFPEEEKTASSPKTSLPTPPVFSGDKHWSILFGSSSADYGYGVVLDESSGNIYVTGTSRGNFDGHQNSGKEDMFLAKYNSLGSKQWSILVGTSENDVGRDVAVDSDGNVYVTGYSSGDFDNHKNAATHQFGGREDMFLMKYNSSGEKQWSTLLGSSLSDHGWAITVDSVGNVYVTGASTGNFDNHTNSSDQDMFLVKYNSSGSKQWSTLFGSPRHTGDDIFSYIIHDDIGTGVAVDSAGNIYVAGYSSGDFDNHTNAGNYDMFLVKYNASGSKQWSTLFGTPDNDLTSKVDVDPAGNIYVTGYSSGDFDNHTNAGSHDMFLVKYNASGSKQWSTLLGTPDSDIGQDMAVDSFGDIYVAGYSSGDFDNHTNAGSYDMFLVKYNSSGSKKRSVLLGTSNNDWAIKVDADSAGNIYVVGSSSGDFDNQKNSGNVDMFLMKYR